MRVVRQTLMLLLLGLALVVPTASAADLESPRAQQAGQSSPDFLERLWLLFTGLWSDAGGGFDPLGACSAGGDAPQASNTDAGGFLDPLGGGEQPPASDTDAGCRIDPLGGCWD